MTETQTVGYVKMRIKDLLFIIGCILFSSTLFAQEFSDYQLSADLFEGENINNEFVTSSNGELVAYLVQEANRNAFNRRLYVVKTDGSSEPVRLASNLTSGFFTTNVTFNSDGSAVAFIYNRNTGLPFEKFAYYVAPTDGGDAVLIDDSIDIVNTTLGLDFKFSIDGATLFYVAATDDNTNGLFRRDVNAQSARQRLDQLDLESTNVSGRFEFASDQTQIIYSANSSTGDEPGGENELYIVGVEGGPSTRLDENGITSLDFIYIEREGLVVYNATQVRFGNRSLFSVPLSGENRINISEGVSGSAGRFRLTFNADRVVFFVGLGTNITLHAASLDGSSLVNLTPSLSDGQILNDEFYVSPTKNQVITEVGTVNISGQPLFLVDFESTPTFTAVSPNRSAIGEVIFSSRGSNIAYKMLQSDPDSAVTFDSRFYITNLNSGEFQQLPTSDDLMINLFEPFSVIGNESVVFLATTASSETNLYAATRTGQEAVLLNRTLSSIDRNLENPMITKFLHLPSQDRLLYIGNTDDQAKRELFALNISEGLITSEEICLPIKSENDNIAVICI